MKDCVFCKIASGEFESAKIWEDGGFVAVLDVNPNVKGMTLVLPKKHYDSNVFEMPAGPYADFMHAAKEVAKVLEKGLSVFRVAMVAEGMGVNHAHVKLYPLHGLSEKFAETWAKDRAFFEKYEGFITTQLGPQADRESLKKIADEIRRNAK